MMSKPAVVEARGLRKAFGEVQALDGLSLAVPAGSVLGLLGPNGSGKTTTVSILATSLRPDAGDATVGGLDVVRQAAQVRRVIGLAGQFAAVDPNLTGRENLRLIGRLSRVGRRQARVRADELLGSFGLNAAAVPAGVDLAGLAAGRVGVVRDAPVFDPAEGGLEFLVAQLERVVVLVDVVVVIEVQADPVGQRHGREVRHRRVDGQAEDVGEELRRDSRVVRGDDGVVQFDGHCWFLSVSGPCGRRCGRQGGRARPAGRHSTPAR